jgi:hypothetical protein
MGEILKAPDKTGIALYKKYRCPCTLYAPLVSNETGQEIAKNKG